MNAKMFEVRDRMTYIPVLAIQLDPTCEQERYMLGRVGFGLTAMQQREYIVVVKLSDMQAQHDEYEWPVSPRTMRAAHGHIVLKWPELKTGDVIDVEYVLGETAAPKEPEKCL